MYRTLLLAIHITGVAAWLGANFVQLLISPRYDREDPAVAAGWARQTLWLGERYYPVAGALIAITGVLMVLDTGWSWSDGFVWVGIAVLVIGGALGGGFFGPKAKARIAALDGGDTTTAAAIQTRIISVAYLDTALVLLAILAMVHKWMA